VLPDFVQAREKYMQILMDRFEKVSSRHMGPMDFKKYKIFEGRRITSVMANGQKFVSKVQKISGDIQILNEDIKSGNIPKAFEYIDKMAIQKAEKESQLLFEEITRITTEAGQVSDNKGKPFDAEIFFMAIQKMQISFKADNTMEKISFVFPPQWEQRVNEVMTELENNPLMKKRYDELIERKRQEWRDREASRKLVG
jgi:hypothetical protein